ncbi:hypothetical protein [Actinoplanes sp. L3-i22]|uniref:hypothetical protein n=1 Tax=Actinoplanes sp. L3-i22 TaxID=2836373 RepID=UPI001C75EABC|nr:hypothetical protein [Actinoplanes sp. L3-i22]BCY15458.1 hypothetical protein L3i22_105460 [Actinoplanes sp. L3-i22]
MQLPSWTDLGNFLESHRQPLLAGLAAVELLIILIVVLRWFNRKYGLRRQFRRLGRFLAAVGRDAIAPIRRALRFRRGVQLIAGRYAGSDPVADAREALESARAVLGDRDDCWPYLVLAGPERVVVGLAGHGRLPEPDPKVTPWRTDGHRWTAARPLPARPDATVARPGPLPVTVGVAGDDLVLLDLARSPGIVSVHGAPGPMDRLVAALAKQLGEALRTGLIDRLLVHKADGPGLGEALEELRQQPPGTGRTVLVCDRPKERAAALIGKLCARDPGLLVLVAGYVPGSRWRLRVNVSGWVISPELGIEADSAPLGQGLDLARTWRETPPQPKRWEMPPKPPGAPKPDISVKVGAAKPPPIAAPAPRLPEPPKPVKPPKSAPTDLVEPATTTTTDAVTARSGD